ncbi:MAG TPA: dienelactone hydrolase family protein [Methylomirabilota bacterium]|jgi:carboxymethylenebutenolidase|nr:dienelactone hydrolase family protein [Methylomirabilota bacterium]
MDTTEPGAKSPLALTRRDALAALAAAGGYALAANPLPAQAIKTDDQGLVAGTVNVAGADGTPIPVYEAYPNQAGEYPVVLVISEVWGLHEWIRDVTRRFGKEGYYAVAPELFSREGGLAQVTDMDKVMNTVFNAPLKRIVGDLRAGAEYARKQPAARADRIGVTGFCWGGQMTLTFPAFYKDTKAAVAWYGPPARAQKDDPKPIAALDVAAEIPCPVLLLYGGADRGIPVADVDKEEAALKAAGRPVEKMVYPDAPHGFLADYRPSYKPEAAKDAWGKCLAWFQKYLKA